MWLDTLLVAPARSPRSITATEKPLRAASRATPSPVIPAPMTATSSGFTTPGAPSDLRLWVLVLVQAPVPGHERVEPRQPVPLDRRLDRARSVAPDEREHPIASSPVRGVPVQDRTALEPPLPLVEAEVARQLERGAARGVELRIERVGAVRPRHQ